MSAARRSIWILLVDGDSTVQQLRALMLRMQGYRVDVAIGLDDARSKIAERKYKLIIVDVGHFADPGLEFCEEIKSKDPHQKMLIHAEDRVFPVKSECPDDVVPKQDGPMSFVKAVERLLQVA
ncbi:MAG TPA: response regulator [Candidatus Angelobacter sp.]|nr:response regulator [Candidatus Angelobacter sp.]